MATADGGLLDAVRKGLAAAGDPVKAPEMQEYMKSALPFHGVQRAQLRALCRELFASHPLPDRATWVATVQQLWREATHREERYVAIELTGDPRYSEYQTPALVTDLYEELVATGAWWDLVDDIAIRRIGPILRNEPGRVTPLMRAWATDEDLWKRRTAIICQMGSKEQTDRDLLTYVVDRNTADDEFFVQKAIGWILREYAKRAPTWVRAFVAQRESALSALSRREALKNIEDGISPPRRWAPR